MPAQKDFRERNSHCQLSVHSADKSWHVIAALVMLANKGTTEQVGDQEWKAERSSAVWGTSFPQQTPARAQPAGWGGQAGVLCLLTPSLCPTTGWSRAGCQPCTPHRQLGRGSGPPAPLVQHRGEKSETSLWSCNCVSAPLGLEQDGRGTKEKSFSKTATDWRWAASEFRLWVNNCVPLQRWDETHFSTLRKLFWRNSPTQFFFSKSVTKWGLESGKIVLIMIPFFCGL